MRTCRESRIAFADPRGSFFLITTLFLCLGPAGAQSAPPDKKAFVQQLRRLYYTPTTAGLRSFSCDARLDWHGVLERAAAGKTIAADDPRVVYLNQVKISFTASLDGKSKIDWVSPDGTFPGDPAALDKMKNGMQGMLHGFFQFWAPNINGTMLPGPKDEFSLEPDNGGYRISVNQGQTSVVEMLDQDFKFKEFNVKTPTMVGDFLLTFAQGPSGFQIVGADGNVSTNGSIPAHVIFRLDYQPVTGFQIPKNVTMEVVNVVRVDYIFDNCKTSQDVEVLPPPTTLK
jgi:hypothetical protein